MSLTAKQAMYLALREAKKGLGFVHPNPPVGCVILDCENKLLSKGYHKKYGADHAEVSAIKKIKNKAKLKKAKVFVTLEPCHHKGKTPSCANTLAHLPLHSLCYGATDPFTKGQGLSYLRKNNIKVTKSTHFQQELKNLIAPFTFSFLHKQAFVSLKVAMSLDGKIALSNGESKWITSQKSRLHAHSLRAKHSAVLVGVNTFLKDNPRLNIRFLSKKKENKVIILDPKGRGFSFLNRSVLLKSHPANQIIFCCFEETKKNKDIKKYIQKTGVKVIFFKPNSAYKINNFKTNKNKKISTQIFDLPKVLKTLYQKESIQSVLVEGGGFTLSEFLRYKLAQKLYLYIAPRIIGSGLSWSEGLAISKLSQSLNLHSVKCHQVGEDICLSGFFN